MSRYQCLKELKCLLYVKDFKFLLSACQLTRLPFRMSCQRNAKFQFHNALKKIENPEGHLILLGKWVLSDDIESLFYQTFFQLMFWNCYRRCEFPSRTRCSQVAVLSLSSPNRVVNGQVGRPKYDIKEETLIELRSLGFSWEDIARMLLVSCWTIHRRVSEFGHNHLPRLYINKLAPKDLSLDELEAKISWRYDFEKPPPSIS